MHVKNFGTILLEILYNRLRDVPNKLIKTI